MTSFLPFRNEHPFGTDLDISSLRFWGQTFEQRDETFAKLRRDAPVSWHAPVEDRLLSPEVHQEVGFWAITRHADIKAVNQNYELFSSQTLVIDAPDQTTDRATQLYFHPAALRPQHPTVYQPPSFLEMDPPRHNRYRRAISQAFTPKAVARINDMIRQRATAIVDDVAGAGAFDFVEEVSSKLPMLTIADMMGVPDSLTETFAAAGNNFISATDPDVVPPGEDPIDFAIKQQTILRDIGIDLVNHRRAHPADDLATSLAHYEQDGSPLTDDEIASMMLLLSVGGNDTTRHTTSHALVALDRNPAERDWLMADFEGRIGQAVEEFIRYATAVLQFGRMATADTVLGGQTIRRGDKVVMFYCSGNRDETVFDEPHRLNLRREPNNHIAFGAGGVHFCIGATIARAQLRAVTKELLTKLPNIEVGEPAYLFSEFIHGIRHLPVKA